MKCQPEFKKKYSQLFYKTINKGYGKDKTFSRLFTYKVEVQKDNGLNGHFTNHLSQAGMYRNHSLKTAQDRERFLNGARDWMDNLS